MIVILKPNVSEARRDQLISWFKAQNLGVHISQGDYQTVLGLIGDTKSVDMDLIASLDIVAPIAEFLCLLNQGHGEVMLLVECLIPGKGVVQGVIEVLCRFAVGTTGSRIAVWKLC